MNFNSSCLFESKLWKNIFFNQYLYLNLANSDLTVFEKCQVRSVALYFLHILSVYPESLLLLQLVLTSTLCLSWKTQTSQTHIRDSSPWFRIWICLWVTVQTDCNTCVLTSSCCRSCEAFRCICRCSLTASARCSWRSLVRAFWATSRSCSRLSARCFSSSASWHWRETDGGLQSANRFYCSGFSCVTVCLSSMNTCVVLDWLWCSSGVQVWSTTFSVCLCTDIHVSFIVLWNKFGDRFLQLHMEADILICLILFISIGWILTTDLLWTCMLMLAFSSRHH